MRTTVKNVMNAVKNALMNALEERLEYRLEERLKGKQSVCFRLSLALPLPLSPSSPPK